MLHLRLLVASLSLAAASWALHESDVGVVDWHSRLVGVPLKTNFHGDLILATTASNVFAAINATDGSLAWRSIHDDDDPIMAFEVYDDSNIALLSGPGGSTLRTYNTSTGYLLLERRLHSPARAETHEVQHTAITTRRVLVEESTAIFALTNGHTVSRIDGQSGNVAWTWNSPDNGTLVVYSHIRTMPDTVYAIGLARSEAAYTLHVTTLSMDNGSTIASVNIPANLPKDTPGFVLLDTPMTAEIAPGPCLTWLESSSIRAAVLTPGLKGQVQILPGVNYTHIRDIGLTGAGHFIAFTQDGSAHVMRYNGESLRPMWEFTDVAPSQTHSESHFAGSFGENGEPRIVRVYWSHANGQAIHQTFTPRLSEGTGQVTGYAFPFPTHGHGVIRHVTFNGRSSDTHETTRFLLTTSTGTLQLWKHNVLQWSREEALSTIRVAAFVPLPQPSASNSPSTGSTSISSTLLTCIQRFSESILQHLYTYTLGPITREDGPMHSSDAPSTLHSDRFGFRQVIVAATTEGVLYGLDSSNGRVIWRRLFGLGWASGSVGGRVLPVKMYVVPAKSGPLGDSSGQEETMKQTVVLVTQRRAHNSLVDTVVFEVDPLTGDDVRAVEDGEGDSPRSRYGPLEGTDVIQGPMIESFVVPDRQGTVAMLDEFLQVQLYPDTPATRESLARLAPSLHLVLSARTSPTSSPDVNSNNDELSTRTQLVGHRLGFNDDVSTVHVAYPTWRITLAPGETIRETILNGNAGREAPVVGKVLGDRKTLYKYLNRHLRVVLTEAKGTCGLYVLDSVKGTILYQVGLPAPEGRCDDIHAVLVDHWLAYSYYEDRTDVDQGHGHGIEGDGTKGWRIVSVEMYEGKKPDDVTRSSELSSYSNATTDITTYEQAHLIPYGVTALSTTSTRLGVTLENLIMASRRHAVYSVHRRLLNARRPLGKASPSEAEEGLIAYDAVLPDDARFALSHNYEVANVRQIISAPSRLESTSLVLAIGLDLFLTRVSPSGTFDVLSESFNKAQLVLTIGGLALAIGLVRPVVRRRQLKARWYSG
ncbi:DUF1620-domain-containing protein [Pisolithus tinctorius]|uniref:ER membrane protein complex subunit 1 n=1 Tax=Pisolithus tinctorius Marx 270 TaxID=870435 RepID=A0A0C3P3Y8_PISTI|nr:DUF1620-domain-containing protein [Pisolithus tinctorius]KIO02186.1 hypothetical protein M404DRAFT_1002608 [Pisolithus tinctorius Marx 270]